MYVTRHRRKWRPTLIIHGKWKTGTTALSFTYGIGAVALECGVADDKRTRRNGDGTAGCLGGYRGGCPTASHAAQQRERVQREFYEAGRPLTGPNRQ